MTQLIISEKPAAAAKIASALGSPKIKKIGKVSYFEITNGKEKIIVAPAVGHLFTLAEKEKSKNYPVFDIGWRPNFEVDKDAAFSKKYYTVLQKLAKVADEFIIACDYDIEGEVIGYNIVRFLCNQKDAKRMKFSTLTADELRQAYKNRSSTIDHGQAEAGLTRHYLDWYWGINLSKALMSAFYLTVHRFQPLSIGRIQGPALEILNEREQEIAKFNPKDFWQISILLDLYGKKFEAFHKTDKFWKEAEAKKIFTKIKDKKASIAGIKKHERHYHPPTPFNLTSLQTEAWRCFKIPPKQTLQIAQVLYTSAYISYPRTSSQIIPSQINTNKILKDLAKQPNYKVALNLLNRKPTKGKKKDPAHPPIIPTGEIPKKITSRDQKIYDLIVKRFLAIFGDPAVHETTHIDFEIKKEPFVLTGTRTVKPGWQALYHPYSEREEVELPAVKKGESFGQKSKKNKKQTEPPRRYSQASLIKLLEKENLGTKATRAQIIDTLYHRDYVQDASIHVTTLGQEIISIFKKYAPEILSKKMTREFEDEMEKIRKKKLSREKTLEKAKKVITNITKKFDQHKDKIGKEISKAFYETYRQQTALETCPKCGKGTIRIIHSKRTGKRFLACDAYPKCRNTWPLPQHGLLKITKTKCKECNTPKINVFSKGRRPWSFCPNMQCPGRAKYAKEHPKKAYKPKKYVPKKKTIKPRKTKTYKKSKK